MEARSRTPGARGRRAPRNPLIDPRRGDIVAFLLAHPDDESIFTGGTIARLAEAGAVTLLITATMGELGRPNDPFVRASLGDDVPIGQVRKEELRAACGALGVTYQVFLGAEGRFADSGYANDRWRDNCLAGNSEAAAAELLAVLRHASPNVLVTFDPDGCTGHPDHLACQEIGLSAAAALSVQDDRLCGLALITYPLARRRSGSPRPGGTPIGVDIGTFFDRKATAVACHFSQVGNAVSDPTRLARFDGPSSIARYLPQVLSDRPPSRFEGFEWRAASELRATSGV
jgi:LmbE family N-acetylglucosaminyl deacetylase